MRIPTNLFDRGAFGALNPTPGFRLRIRSFVREALILAVAFIAFIPVLAEEESRPLPKVFQKFASKSGDVVVELRGNDDDLGFPRQAWVFTRSTGKKILLPPPETYIVSGAISEDGRYIVLVYHVSSGGDGEAFERTKPGGFRRFLENDYACNQVEEGRIAGMNVRDLPDRLYCGIALAGSPDRIVFTFNGSFALTYSLKLRRITDWQRTLLTSNQAFRGDGIALHVDALSGDRGIALTSVEISESGAERRETLARFPDVRSIPKAGDVTKFKLKAGEVEFIELGFRRAEEDSADGAARWEVEVTGMGRGYELLRERLAAKWKAISDSGRESWAWREPTKFIVSAP